MQNRESKFCIIVWIAWILFQNTPYEWVWKKPNAAIVVEGENRTSASLRGHSVCSRWSAGVYGYYMLHDSDYCGIVYGMKLAQHGKQVPWRQRLKRLTAQRSCQHLHTSMSRSVFVFAYECGCILKHLKSFAVLISELDFVSQQAGVIPALERQMFCLLNVIEVQSWHPIIFILLTWR